tara:strand:+ start:1172 stop:1963 length:792 start_codon:yes stop_codon:yes gene_type:complete
MINNFVELIKEINNNKTNGLLISRLGNVEISALLENTVVPEKLFRNAGFYGDIKCFQKWKELYLEALEKSDCLLDVTTCPSFIITNDLLVKYNIWIPTLNYREDPLWWILLLIKIQDTNPIGIVSYFKKDIDSQLKNINKIWKTDKLNNNFITVKSESTIHGNKVDKNWLETFEKLKLKVDQEPKPRVWLVSCGCYGLPLCNYIKSQGKVAIYLGGILQLLFGIKGQRWDTRTEVTHCYNEHWIYPSIKPKNAELVENGCYWK